MGSERSNEDNVMFFGGKEGKQNLILAADTLSVPAFLTLNAMDGGKKG